MTLHNLTNIKSILYSKSITMEESICRLCIKKLNNENSYDIFPPQSEGVRENVIPMRLAAVAAIEVAKYDSLPKKLCPSCRYQLELSYFFRKNSQICDAKLRKQQKLLSQGKTVTNIVSFEEDDEDEISDSLAFLKDFERSRDASLKEQVRREVEADTQNLMKDLEIEKLRLEIEKEIRSEIDKLEHEKIKKIKGEENKAILNDLEEFLKMKQKERIEDDITFLTQDHQLNNNISKELQQNGTVMKIANHGKMEFNVNKNSQQLRSDQVINNQVQNMKSSCNNIMSYQIKMYNDVPIEESGNSIDDNIESFAVIDCNDMGDNGCEVVKVLHNDDDGFEFLKLLDDESEDDETKDSHCDEEKITASESLEKSSNISYICVDPQSQTTGRTTATPKIFKCKFCTVKVSTEWSLQRHMRVHRKSAKSVTCPECKRVVSCPSALKRHIIIHSGKRPYVCGECNKAFGQKEILKRHEDTQHKGLRYHRCPYCKQKFSQRPILAEHIEKNHQGEERKRFKCHLCPKSFFFPSGLSRHLNHHSGKTYQCVECVRTFNDHSSIRRHILGVHGAEKAQQIIGQTDLKNKIHQ